MSVWTWVGVALLGGLAACARFLLVSLIATRHSGNLPLGVLAVNVSGSLLLGLLAGLAVSGSLLVLTGTATLGSYATFSTWMLETQRLGEDGRVRAGLLNVVGSLGLVVAGSARPVSSRYTRQSSSSTSGSCLQTARADAPVTSMYPEPAAAVGAIV